jgi:hypothetical protein
MFIIVLTKNHKVIGCINKLECIINISIVFLSDTCLHILLLGHICK